jgi:drug/metabolite transporter (DMT)-like permease
VTEAASIPSRAERLKADSILLLVAMIWGSAFVAQRVAALNMGAYAFNGLRFLLGGLVLLPFAWRSHRNSARIQRNEVWGIALAGLLLFGGSSFQQFGMQFTTASNAGFITGLYVVFIPLILAIGWRQRPRREVWVASFCAATGLFLLSTGGRLRLAPGDALVLISAGLWACHVIWVGRLVQRLDALRIAFGQNLVCGGLSLAIALGSAQQVFPEATTAWGAILYTAVFSIGIGYTLQVVGQRVAPPADAAIILSLEAVFAALTGWLVLDEHLTVVQLLGCGLMLAGMLLAQLGAYAGEARRSE